MCLIIDANKAADFCNRTKLYMHPLWDWVDGGGRIASDGKLEKELLKILKMRPLVAEWARRGSIVRVNKTQLASETVKISQKCRSDDPHVLALAKLSGAAIVVTEDTDLIADLKDATLVGKRRLIYKENSASKLRVDRHKKMLAGVRCP